MLLLTNSACLLWLSAILLSISGIYPELTLFAEGLLQFLHRVDTVRLSCFFLFFSPFVWMCTGPEQTSVPARWHTDTWRLPGETAAEQSPLRPAAEPTLPQSITGKREGGRERKEKKKVLQVEGVKKVRGWWEDTGVRRNQWNDVSRWQVVTCLTASFPSLITSRDIFCRLYQVSSVSCLWKEKKTNKTK